MVKYAYMKDLSTPSGVVRRIALTNKLQNFKYYKMKNARLLEKDDMDGKLKEHGLKWQEVTKEDFINSAIRGIEFARANYENLGLEFDLKGQIKKLSKKLGITQKEIEEKLNNLED